MSSNSQELKYVQRDAFWSRRSGALTPESLELINEIVRGTHHDRQPFDARIDAFVDALRETVGKHWLTIAASIALDAGTQGPGGQTDFVDRFGVEAHIQFLIAACADLPYVIDYVPPQTVQAAYDCVNEIFELEAAATYCDFPTESYSDRTSRGLVIEAIYDRFEFYGRHALELKEAILDPVKGLFEAQLGWTIDDYWSLADAASYDSNEKRDAVSRRLRADPHALDDEIEAHGEWETHMSIGAEICFHEVKDLARLSGLEENRAKKLLNQLSLPMGGATTVRSPRTVSPLRTTPTIRMADDRYFIPFPHLWKQDTFRIVDAATSGSVAFRAKWLHARDEGTETLVAARLGRLFGSERVLRSVTHVGAELQGETDVLVDLDNDALIVECKAHTLTPAGRRGAPSRVETKTAEILEKAFSQVQKGRSHLLAGLTIKPAVGAPRSIAVDENSDLLGLVVSFERIDPMFMHTALRSFAVDSVLAIGLPDFLSITDMLQWPSAFYHYLSERSKILGLNNVRATTEQEFLGMFLEDQQLSYLVETSEDVDGIWVDGYGPSLNRYLAVRPGKFSAPPLRYPPKPVLSALRAALNQRSAGWTTTAENVHSVQSTDWVSLKGMLRRSSPRSSKSRMWKSPDGKLSIAIAEKSAVSVHGDLLEIGPLDPRRAVTERG